MGLSLAQTCVLHKPSKSTESSATARWTELSLCFAVPADLLMPTRLGGGTYHRLIAQTREGKLTKVGQCYDYTARKWPAEVGAVCPPSR